MKPNRGWFYSLIGMVMIVALATSGANAFPIIKIASLRDFALEKHNRRGNNKLTEADDYYEQLGKSLNNVTNGHVTWWDKGKLDKSNIIKRRISLANGDISEAFQANQGVSIKDIKEPRKGDGWYTIGLEVKEGPTPRRVVLDVWKGNAGSSQILNSIAVKTEDGRYVRFDIEQAGSSGKRQGYTYFVRKDYFNYRITKADASSWVRKVLHPSEGVAAMVVNYDYRDLNSPRARIPVDLFTEPPDRVLLEIVLDEEHIKGEKDYEIILGWIDREIAIGGGGGLRAEKQ